MSPYEKISVEEVKAKLDGGEKFRLIDVREPNEHRGCRIESAELKPLGQIGQWIADLPDRGEEIILYCHHGMRSDRACGFLAQQGFTNVKNMLGGIDDWSLRVDPSVPRY
ncbi:MAG: rhodanese-like domain-containing protein [Acidobacteriota bacterium]